MTINENADDMESIKEIKELIEEAVQQLRSANATIDLDDLPDDEPVTVAMATLLQQLINQ